MRRGLRCARLSCSVFVCCSVALCGRRRRGLDPAKLLKPGTDSWPTYNGDYSGRRFSTLDEDQRRRTSTR